MVFPDPYSALLDDDPTVEAALASALAETRAVFPAFGDPPRVALSIAAIDSSTFPPSFRHAGLHAGQTHYSASLLKVAAMYAAHELRAAVNALGVDVSSGPELFATCRQAFDGDIEVAVPRINKEGIARALRVPSYEKLFTAVPLAGGGVSVEFSGAFQAALVAAIVTSDNAAAATCVKALGYSWINGALAAGGYFVDDSRDGVWLAGTFTGDQPYVRIESVNDGPVAQATTTFDLANMYAHMLAGSLVDPASCAQMLTLLRSAQAGVDPSFLDGVRRPGTGSTSLLVTHTKIGLGPLKSGAIVASEGTFVLDPPSGRQFLVVFQNCSNDNDSLRAMTFLVERVVAAVVGAP